MNNLKRNIIFVLEQFFFGSITWIYISFLAKLLLHYTGNILAIMVIILLMGAPLRFFVLENSFKKNEVIFKRKMTNIQDLIILFLFVLFYTCIGNAYDILNILK